MLIWIVSIPYRLNEIGTGTLFMTELKKFQFLIGSMKSGQSGNELSGYRFQFLIGSMKYNTLPISTQYKFVSIPYRLNEIWNGARYGVLIRVSIPYRLNEIITGSSSLTDWTGFQFLIGSMKFQYHRHFGCDIYCFNSL